MDGHREVSESATPTRVAGRYRLGEPLGRGRSTVFRALDTRLERRVAVKQVELLAGQEDVEKVRGRALREAQAAARLNNPRVVTVFDVVEEAGSIWLVMELVEAPSLAQVVVDGGPMPHRRAARIGLDVLTALEAAHGVGVVHRDVKPANVMVQAGDRAKLTDFGVATIRDGSRLTATGLIVGSPSYMSPEQAQGAEVGPPTDLWSLGALLYFASEGEPPFNAGSALATASAVVHGEPRPAQFVGPLTEIIAGLLTKDPAGRPNAGEVRAGLTRVARGQRSRRRTTRLPASGPPPPVVPEAADPTPEVFPPVTDAPARGPDDAGSPAAAGGVETDVPAVAAEVGVPPVVAQREPSPVVSETDHEVPPGVPEHDPDDVPRRTYRARERPRSRLALLAVAAAVVLLTVWASALSRGDDNGEETTGDEATATSAVPAGDDPSADDDPTADEDSPATTAPPTPITTATDAPGTTAPATTAPATGAQTASGPTIPAGWTPYQDPSGRYSIAHPPGWSVVARTATITDFRDPATGSYLRVDWTDAPKDDPTQDWREQAVVFARSHANYQEVSLGPATYRDYNAAVWEFTYGSGTTVHATNLGFVTGGRGYALLFQTPEDLWASSQDLNQQFRDAFRPVPV